MKVSVISYLIEGLSENQIVKNMKTDNIIISKSTVNNIYNQNKTDIINIKKENRKILLENDNEKYKSVVSGFLDVSRRALAHITDRKLKESSGAALATISGISVDKHTIATGGVTERVEVKFKNRSSMLEYIQKKVKLNK